MRGGGGLRTATVFTALLLCAAFAWGVPVAYSQDCVNASSGEELGCDEPGAVSRQVFNDAGPTGVQPDDSGGLGTAPRLGIAAGALIVVLSGVAFVVRARTRGAAEVASARSNEPQVESAGVASQATDADEIPILASWQDEQTVPVSESSPERPRSPLPEEEDDVSEIEPDVRVCPRCGNPAGEQRFCAECGLNLSSQAQIPKRDEWEATHRLPEQPGAQEQLKYAGDPAGWYADPDRPGYARYWTGSRWEGKSRRDVTPTASAEDPRSGPRQRTVVERSSSGPAGWYALPNDPTTERYWDGENWTNSYQPARAGRVGADGKEQEATGVVVAGYIFAVLMPIVGFIIGLTQINRNRHGIWVVLLSIVVFVVYLAIITSVGSGGGNRYGY